MKRSILAALVSMIILAAPAAAQWQVTNNAVVIGRGAGTGFDSALCTSAQLLVGQSAAKPLCKTITGDVTIDAAGATAIGATKVMNAMLNADVFSSAHTWALAQTFTVAPVFTDGPGSRSALGLAIGTDVQAYNARLAAIAGFASTANRLYGADGSGNGSLITLPAAGLALSAGALALANDLAALEGLASNGCAARTAPDTWAVRTLTGTANQITVTNGDCVSGNPTLSIPTSPVFTGTTTPSEAFALTGDISPSQLVANTNDWAPTGFSTASAVRFSTDASRNITGLAGGTDGRIIILHNVGSFDAILTNADGASTAANQFLFGGDVTLAANTSITLRYDATSSRWRAITSPGSGGGGGGSVTSVTLGAGYGISVSGTNPVTTSGTFTPAVGLTYMSNSLASNVALNNTANYFTGPIVAQGTSGTWFASGTVTVYDTAGAAQIFCQLTDGTTLIAASRNSAPAANNVVTISLSGVIASPAGDIRIQCKDVTSTSGLIAANVTTSATAKDSTLTVTRIQ